jgi:hypothetical protein
METSPVSNTVLTVLHEAHPAIPEGARATTALIELPPRDPGTPPHRHAGPVFGFMLEGEIRAGEAFWEPGGDVIHYQRTRTAPNRTVLERHYAPVTVTGDDGVTGIGFCYPGHK